MITARLILVTLFATHLFCEIASAQQLVDLSHAFDEQTIYWPTEKGFVLERGPAGVTERGYYYAANRFAAPEHGGTHLDAPIHFFDQRQTVERIPLKRLVGPGARVDVRAACAADRDYLVTVADLTAWEREHGASLEGRIVLLDTGYAAHWGDREAYLGTAATGRAAVSQLHFPGLDPAAAEWLATRRHVRCVGIDTASVDHGPSLDFRSHVVLCEQNVPVLENVAAMDALPVTGFRVIALPMKIAGGSGAPCRVAAIIEDGGDE